MLTDLDYELLSAYIDNALSQSERMAFELRLQAEPELSRELDELRATVTLLNNLPIRKAPRDFTLDARYARRTSFFFTSATFSALSTAAAVILFALGAYLFTGNKSAAPATSSQPIVESARLSTATVAALDKSSAVTPTELASLNSIGSTSTVENNPMAAAGLASTDGVAQESATVEASPMADQLPLVEPDMIQSTNSPADMTSSSAAPAGSAAADSQRSTNDATQTLTLQQYAAPITGGSVGSAAPAPMQQTDSNAASSVFAATQPPLTATALPTARPMPTVTDTPTATNTSQPSPTATLVPTAVPLPPTAPSTADVSDSLPLLLIGLAVILFIIAIITTIIRRRNRL